MFCLILAGREVGVLAEPAAPDAAIAMQHDDAVRTLLTHRADPNTPEEQAPDGQALWNASAYGHVEVVKVLLKYNADPAFRDADGDSAKDFATRNRHVDVVQLLAN